MNLKQYNALREKLNFSPRPYAALFHLSLNYLLAVSAVMLLTIENLPVVLVLTAQVALSMIAFRSFALMHEAVHSTFGRGRIFNELFGSLAGFLAFLPYLVWKAEHLEHHKWAGNIDRDPVNKIRRNYRQGNRVRNTFLNVVWRSWIPILGLLQMLVFWSNGAVLVIRAKRFFLRMRMLSSLLAPLVLYGILVLQLNEGFVLVRLLVAIAFYLALTEAINLPHHLETYAFRGDKRLSTMEQYRVSRSCLYPEFIGRWVTLNFNLHTEHHLFPTLPWQELRGAQVAVSEVLGANYQMDVGNRWLIRNRLCNITGLLGPQRDRSIPQSEAPNKKTGLG